ncbi:MAG: RagB/SusD family nutrient uptake outer membrane protein [Bacteroidota bacterium]
MNRKIKLISFSAIILIALMIACDDYIDVEEVNRLDVESFYETNEDADQALIAVYDILQWHHNLQDWASPYMIKTLPSDEGTAGGENSSDQLSYQAMDDMAWDEANSAILGVWSMNYWGVYRTNLVINNTEPDTDTKVRIIAEARALRAYYYFELVSMFGDVPLILDELLLSEANKFRTPASEIYAQIEQDLRDAIPDLPLKSAYSVADKFRISKGTAQSLLGKAYLYQQDYTNAASAFDEVINSGEYSLEANFSDIFKEDFEFGNESIFETNFISTFGYDWGTDFSWGQRAESNIHIQLTGTREGLFYTFLTPDGDQQIVGWGFNYPSEKLYNAFDAADPRRDATVIDEATYVASALAFAESNDVDLSESDVSGDLSDVYDYTGYIRTKFATKPSESTDAEGGVIPLNYGTNFRLIRYADVLLLAAEAHNATGNDAQAQNYLNQVRTRVGLGNISLTGEDLFNAIEEERFVELAFEGHRYFDLVRWNLADSELEGFEVGKHELLPIPLAEIQAAPALTQNDGY